MRRRPIILLLMIERVPYSASASFSSFPSSFTAASQTSPSSCSSEVLRREDMLVAVGVLRVMVLQVVVVEKRGRRVGQ